VIAEVLFEGEFRSCFLEMERHASNLESDSYSFSKTERYRNC